MSETPVQTRPLSLLLLKVMLDVRNAYDAGVPVAIAEMPIREKNAARQLKLRGLLFYATAGGPARPTEAGRAALLFEREAD